MPEVWKSGQVPAGRRSFLQFGVAASVAGCAQVAQAQLFQPNPNFRDTAILQFTQSAELVAADIWSQLGAAAQNNPSFVQAMAAVDPNLPQYVIDIARDEVSHAAFLTAFLPTVGVAPINLDTFRTLPDTTGAFTPPTVPNTANPNPPTGTGTGSGTGTGNGTGTGSGSADVSAQQTTGRLTNLTSVNIDTSWYIKYRSALNPDLGATPPQLLTLRGRSVLPAAGTGTGTGTGLAGPTVGPSCPATGTGTGTGGTGTGGTQATPTPDLMARAYAALLFGSMTEQMETSTYTALGGKISSPYVQGVLGSLQPVEFAHYIAFQTALSRAAGFTSPDNIVFPDLRCRADAASVLPAPTFLVAGLPPVSAVRPIMTPLGGAVALVNALTNANVFQGQPPAFLTQMMQLAAAADASTRG